MAMVPRWLTRRRLIIAVIGLGVAAVVWWFSAYPRGMIVAWVDHVRGHYEIKTYGLPPQWTWEYVRLVREKYGVEVNMVAGCVVDPELEWYVDGYNSVSKARIRARFGKDIFGECFAEARAAWKLAHPQD